MEYAAIYSRALTPSEIQSLYMDPWQGYGPDPVERYVTSGGEPPATPHTQVIFISSVPVLIVLLAMGMTYADRRKAA